MVTLQKISPDWQDEPCLVMAPGPSLTADVVRRARFARWMDGWRAIAVNDSYKVTPWADALYASDLLWWRVHKDCNGFKGEKWSTHTPFSDHIDDKSEAVKNWGVKVVSGAPVQSFSTNPKVIHWGSNSGFQAINLAILKGCKRIVLIGFDMRRVNGEAHFFGEHPQGLSQRHDYGGFIPDFNAAAKKLPDGVEILNATEGSALKCFPFVSLDEALRRHNRVHRDGSELNARAG